MYNFPLLEVVGVTSTEMAFSICFAYIEHKQEDNYNWALDKLKGFMDNNMFSQLQLIFFVDGMCQKIFYLTARSYFRLMRYENLSLLVGIY